jgi:hypothetical protein
VLKRLFDYHKIELSDNVAQYRFISGTPNEDSPSSERNEYALTYLRSEHRAQLELTKSLAYFPRTASGRDLSTG